MSMELDIYKTDTEKMRTLEREKQSLESSMVEMAEKKAEDLEKMRDELYQVKMSSSRDPAVTNQFAELESDLQEEKDQNEILKSQVYIYI